MIPWWAGTIPWWWTIVFATLGAINGWAIRGLRDEIREYRAEAARKAAKNRAIDRAIAKILNEDQQTNRDWQT